MSNQIFKKQKLLAPAQVKSAQCIFVNHSGGKDSQAMMAYLMWLTKQIGFTGEIVVVHSDLGEMEHEEMAPWIETISFGHTVHVVKPELGFFDLCRKYGRLPTAMSRFCTSDLKTKPIGKFVREWCLSKGYTNVINALGLRGEESGLRDRKPAFIQSDMPGRKDGITIMEWLPIKEWKIGEVFAVIEACGQKPHHVYAQGYSRLSCKFCVLGKVSEHREALERFPELAVKLHAIEAELGKAFHQKSVKGEKIWHPLKEKFTASEIAKQKKLENKKAANKAARAAV